MVELIREKLVQCEPQYYFVTSAYEIYRCPKFKGS